MLKKLIQYRGMVFAIDFILLLVGIAAFHRTTIRADVPGDFVLKNGQVFTDKLPKKGAGELALGDRVLLLNGQIVTSPRELEYLTNGMSIGTTAFLDVARTGKTMRLQMILTPYHTTRYLMVQGMVGLLFMAIGWLLFIKRPGDIPAAILHMCFIFVGMQIMMTPTRYSQPWLWLSRTIDVFSALGIAFAPVLLFHFSLVFPRQNLTREFVDRLTKAFYGAAVLICVWFAWVMVEVGSPATLDDFHSYCTAYSVSRWFFCLCVIVAVCFLIRSSFRSSGDAERRQMRWILLGLSTGPFIWAATWQIPILMGYDPLVSEEASLAILAIVPVVFAIAIIQYRFMDVDVVMHSGLIVIFASGVAAASWAINSSALASVTAALLVAMLFEGQERERLTRMKSFFVSGVSHDLKTPLTGIKMYTQLLKKTKPDDEVRRQQFLKIIEGEADRLTRLIDNVLSFSRLERGKREYKMVSSNLNQIVRETLQSMEYPIHMGGFKLKKNISRQKLMLEADRDALNEAIGNLITNGIKYSTSKKVLAIGTVRLNDWVVVRVQDWGSGIPQEEHSKIFEPFYRSPHEKGNVVGGVGLGLALVKNIVDEHGGYVDLVSVPGKGSTFTLWFPGKEDS
jgi:signal transduction histidine kinase